MRGNNQKHVLIVPAWYPTARDPYLGTFVREQARALQAFGPDLTVSVWNWCPRQFHSSFKRPIEMVRLIRQWRRRPQTQWTTDEAGLNVYVKPVFEPPRPFPCETKSLVRTLRDVLNTVAADRGRVDLVHSHIGMPAGWASSEACPQLGIPTIVTEHMGPQMFADLAPSGVLARKWQSAYSKSDSVIAVSAAQSDMLRHYTGLAATVLPNVVNEDEFFPTSDPLPATAPFLVVAGLRPVKAIDVLLRAYARVSSIQPLPCLRIGGDGFLLDSLVCLARSLGINARVHFIGRMSREAVQQEMRRCAALIISSRSESFSVATIEAMACGRPVLSTACGGPEEIITDSTGIIVRNNEEALAEGIKMMTARWTHFDPNAVRKHAVSRYGRAAVARRLRDHYDAVLAARVRF